jgi:hypothetical protein
VSDERSPSPERRTEPSDEPGAVGGERKITPEPGHELDEEVRPPRLAMLLLVLFPFALVVIFGLLYAWIRR